MHASSTPAAPSRADELELAADARLVRQRSPTADAAADARFGPSRGSVAATDHATDARLVGNVRRGGSSWMSRVIGRGGAARRSRSRCRRAPRAAASPQPIVAADARFGPSRGSVAAADHATDVRLGRQRSPRHIQLGTRLIGSGGAVPRSRSR
jgi:hypothetical protein